MLTKSQSAKMPPKRRSAAAENKMKALPAKKPKGRRSSKSLQFKPIDEMLWLLRQRHLHTREGDNNPTVGLGLTTPTDTDDTDPFEPVSYVPIIKPYVIWKKDLTCMEKKPKDKIGGLYPSVFLYFDHF